MSSRAAQQVRLELLLGASCSASLLGSVWAATTGCDACQRASELTGGLPLATLGMLFYAHLLFVLMLRRARSYFFSCVLFAAGVHLVLVAILLRRHVLCPACYLAAAGAFTMAGLSVLRHRQILRTALVIVPAGILLAVTARPLFPTASPSALARQKQIRLALAREEAEPPVAAGKVRLLVYWRPTCIHCRELQTHVLPAIRQEFGPMLDIQYRPAWTGLRTPTLVLRGERRMHIVGLPSLDRLREAIRSSRG